ncbi:MAG: efflux RND transporter periplasmic adaptor subunit [Deltaproteobacteria bacterium]|jgi:HlyD family secretion protein|nr:efflux RND transporter periplasmic adaptor subunit [Deltaproteobacteria bacterium]
MKSILSLIISGLMVGLACGRVAVAASPDPKTAVAETRNISEYYQAVGTVRPRLQSHIAARMTAQVVEVKVNPGDKIEKGQLLITLDSRQNVSSLEQARQGLKGAEASKKQARQAIVAAAALFQQTESDFKRITSYYQSQAATEQNLEQARAAYLQAQAQLQQAKESLAGAEAGIKQAREMVQQAEIALSDTLLVAQEAGHVLQRLVDPGDMAMPGRPLITLQTAGGLQLEASVREGLIRKIALGDELQVEITALTETVAVKVEEIVPYADPQSRTFLIKASLPEMAGLYPGMFGKLLIPVQELEVVMIPQEAVRRVGQLELVLVREEDIWKRRFIQTGRRSNGRVEVLSGLSGGETVSLGAAEAGAGP